jgi:hypothetical protein
MKLKSSRREDGSMRGRCVLEFLEWTAVVDQLGLRALQLFKLAHHRFHPTKIRGASGVCYLELLVHR